MAGGAIKEIVVLGELFAASSVMMAVLFVMVDLGRLDRFWHMLPLIGKMNFPQSLLAWDVLALNGYFFLNILIPVYLLVRYYYRKEPNWKFILPFILASIPWAVAIHTVTAFLYNGLPARPFWNASILAPRFLASAFCSGPAIIILILQIIRKVSAIHLEDSALFKIADLIAPCAGWDEEGGGLDPWRISWPDRYGSGAAGAGAAGARNNRLRSIGPLLPAG